MKLPPAWAFLRGCNPQWPRTGFECTACHEDKPQEAFYFTAKGKREAMCKKCRSAHVMARYRARRAA